MINLHYGPLHAYTLLCFEIDHKFCHSEYPPAIFRQGFTQASATGILDAVVTLSYKPAKTIPFCIKIPLSPSQGSNVMVKLASNVLETLSTTALVVDAVNHMATHTDVQKACSSNTESWPSITFRETVGEFSEALITVFPIH